MVYSYYVHGQLENVRYGYRANHCVSMLRTFQIYSITVCKQQFIISRYDNQVRNVYYHSRNILEMYLSSSESPGHFFVMILTK